MEIHRRDAGHQVGDPVLVQGGVTEAEGPALADAQQVDALHAAMLPDDVHGVVQVAIDVIIQGQARIALVGTTPVEQVNVQAGPEQALDQRAAVLQIHDVRPVDQGVYDQDGDSVGFIDLRPVTVQAHLVLPVHLVPGRRSHLYGGRIGQPGEPGGSRQSKWEDIWGQSKILIIVAAGTVRGDFTLTPPIHVAPHGKQGIHQTAEVAGILLGKGDLRVRLLAGLQPEAEVLFQGVDVFRGHFETGDGLEVRPRKIYRITGLPGSR